MTATMLWMMVAEAQILFGWQIEGWRFADVGSSDRERATEVGQVGVGRVRERFRDSKESLVLCCSPVRTQELGSM